jgi:hypothetical protein
MKDGLHPPLRVLSGERSRWHGPQEAKDRRMQLEQMQDLSDLRSRQAILARV